MVWIGRDDAPVTTAPTTPPPDGTDDEVLALADRLFRAIEAADLETVRACWSEDAVLWTNFSGARDRETSLSVLRWLTTKMPDLSYEITRRERVAGGFLQQHVLRGTAPDGTAIEMPACVVATVDGGVITRVDEYLDPAATAPLAARS